jgi:hypothetical protein
MQKRTIIVLIAVIVVGIILFIVVYFSTGKQAKQGSPPEVSVANTDSVKFDTVLDKPFTVLFPFSVPDDSLYKYYDTLLIADSTYFLVQGDLLLDKENFKKQLVLQYWQGVEEVVAMLEYKRLQDVIITYDKLNRDTIKWEKFPIRYAINQQSFNEVAGGYDSVRNRMQRAARDWENVCRVAFTYVPEGDQRPESKELSLDFVVQYKKPAKATTKVAISFFPNDAANLRRLNILPGYWNTQYDKTGILRHEIGHILGFRHEHAAKIDLVPLDCIQRFAEAPVPSRAITVYDSFSVMHYFCGGAGTRQMSFSRKDTIGFTMIYGKN